MLSISIIRNDIRCGEWSKLPAALLIAAGLGFTPTMTLTAQEEEEPLAPSSELPEECGKSEYSEICGDKIALLRVIKKMDSDKYKTYVGYNSRSHKTDNTPETKGVVIDVTGHDDVTANFINVTIKLPKSYLRTTLPESGQASDPVELFMVSVTGKSGTDSCYWDCYWVNAKRKCECINY